MVSVPCLPRADRAPAQRAAAIQASRKTYEWTHDLLPGVALSTVVPPRNRPRLRWVLAHVFHFYLTKLNQLLAWLVGAPRVGQASSISDYERMFVCLPVPSIARTFRDDATFSRLRVAGLNPMIIRRVTAPNPSFPVTDAHLRAVPGFEGDSLEAARAEGRLYLADYSMVAPKNADDWPDPGKFSHAPLALFAVPRGSGSLRAIAIQCEQQSGPDAPIFTPADGYAWMMARTIVEVADVAHHQPAYHGITHLVAGAFNVAMYRNISERHPLYVLLDPHFAGTLYINDMAVDGLLAPGTLVDDIMSGSIRATRRIAAETVHGTSLRDLMLPRAFALRGVDDAAALPDYPYRDDALLVWGAIRQWVCSYLALYYRSAADVLVDGELRAWLADATSWEGGRLRYEAESLATVEELCDLVTLIIFNSSAQHAALNYPQGPIMSFVPASPMAAYLPAPTTKEDVTEAEWLAMLPPFERAEQQLELGYRLAAVGHTRLGYYPRRHFRDPRVAPLLSEFQARLRDVESAIHERNATRDVPYEFLLPSKIPQSVDI
ncbi:lipoxygenase family protein [Sorangium sp. So ce118]